MTKYVHKIKNFVSNLFDSNYEDDKLRFLLDISMALVQKPLYLFITLLVVIYFSAYAVFVIIFYVFNNFNVKVDITHLPFAMFALHKTLVIKFILQCKFKEKQMFEISTDLQPWNRCSERVAEKIASELRVLKRLTAIILFVNYTICLSVSPIKTESLYFMSELVSSYFPNLKLVNNVVCTIFVTYLGHFSIAQLFVVAYVFMHLIFQFYFVADYLSNVSNGYVPAVDDTEYQQIIKQKLVTATQKYLVAIRYANWFQSMCDSALGVLVTGNLIPGICLALIFSSPVLNYTNFIFGLSVVLVLVIMIMFTSIGQKVTNAHEDIYVACLQMPWETWNEENRRIYQMFLIMCMQPLTFSSYGLIELNTSFLLKVYRVSISLITWICQLIK